MSVMRPILAMSVIVGCVGLCGCFDTSPSKGGGQVERAPSGRRVNPADVLVWPGYRIEAVAQGLTFPTGVTFDEQGVPHVTEAGYSYGDAWTTPRLVRIEPDGRATEIARGTNPPWNGVTFHEGSFYVAEGGHKEGGKILRIDRDGRVTVLIDGLPSLGDHHTNGPVVREGFIYFGQGTATNSGVVGLDNAKMGWLSKHPQFHDIPARDIKLAGVNFESPALQGGGKVRTGAFVPFGTETREGQVIEGQAKFGGGIMRIPVSGSAEPEMVAWGMRNPYGLAFSNTGELFVTENSYDVRGSRPVWGTGDPVWRVQPGLWYGWPDYFAGERLDQGDRFKAPDEPVPPKLLAEDPNAPPKPVTKLGVHAGIGGLDFADEPMFGHVGDGFVAEFGDMAPMVGKVMSAVGYRVVKFNPATGHMEAFASNRGEMNGPASLLKTGGLERPIDVEFSPDGRAMYIVDFGIMTMSDKGPQPKAGTGVLWRVVREEGGR
jgi:hypothetical protein